MELVQAVSKYPDWIKMHTDPYGDSCFYIVRREQLYARRLLQHSGGIGESIPTVYGGASAYENNNNSAYVTIPSGSVVTSDSQLFNRPYWLSKAQGPNNGVCWHNNVFITVLDNTRNTIMNISIKADDANGGDIYKPKDFVAFVRHVEEFELMCLVRLCKVPLEPPVLAHIYRMSPSILEGWGISEFPQVLSGSEDKYRYLDSQATRCPLPAPPAPPAKRDPWGSLHFWDVDCTGRLSLELPLFPLGRKYLALPYVAPPVRPSRATARTKRPASASGTPVAGNTRAKRRRR
nr:MAG: L1 protein [Garrodia papillomavirus]